MNKIKTEQTAEDDTAVANLQLFQDLQNLAWSSPLKYLYLQEYQKDRIATLLGRMQRFSTASSPTAATKIDLPWQVVLNWLKYDGIIAGLFTILGILGSSRLFEAMVDVFEHVQKTVRILDELNVQKPSDLIPAKNLADFVFAILYADYEFLQDETTGVDVVLAATPAATPATTKTKKKTTGAVVKQQYKAEISTFVTKFIRAEGLDLTIAKKILQRLYPKWFQNHFQEIEQGLKILDKFVSPKPLPRLKLDNYFAAPTHQQPGCATGSTYAATGATGFVKNYESSGVAEVERLLPTAAKMYEAVASIADKNKQSLHNSPPASSCSAKLHTAILAAPYFTRAQLAYLVENGFAKKLQLNSEDTHKLSYIIHLKQTLTTIVDDIGGNSLLPQTHGIAFLLGDTLARSKTSEILAHPNDFNYAQMQMNLGGAAAQNTNTTATAPNNFSKTTTASINSDSDEDSARATLSAMKLQQQQEVQALLGTSLLGPADMAGLLRAILSDAEIGHFGQRALKSLTELLENQPKIFTRGVFYELSVNGSQRILAGLLMRLLDAPQDCFRVAESSGGQHGAGGFGTTTAVNNYNGTLFHSGDHTTSTTKSTNSFQRIMSKILQIDYIPRRIDFMAGGRYQRRSYYEAIYDLATNLIDESDEYLHVKQWLTVAKGSSSRGVVVVPGAEELAAVGLKNQRPKTSEVSQPAPAPAQQLSTQQSKSLIATTKESIARADELGCKWLKEIFTRADIAVFASEQRDAVLQAYSLAFSNCRRLIKLDKSLLFKHTWLKDFYERNYEALVVFITAKNVLENVETVRQWLVTQVTLNRGDVLEADNSRKSEEPRGRALTGPPTTPASASALPAGASREDKDPKGPAVQSEGGGSFAAKWYKQFFEYVDNAKAAMEQHNASTRTTTKNSSSNLEALLSQAPSSSNKIGTSGLLCLLFDIIHVTYFYEEDRIAMQADPLSFLLYGFEIGNETAKKKNTNKNCDLQHFSLITAMGVITEGAEGKEMESTFARLMQEFGCKIVRADTGTARHLEYNSSQIQKAIVAHLRQEERAGDGNNVNATDTDTSSAALSLNENYRSTPDEEHQLHEDHTTLLESGSEIERQTQLKPLRNRKHCWAWLGYSQGNANFWKAEAEMNSGTPEQQELLKTLVCRHSLYSAANGTPQATILEQRISECAAELELLLKNVQLHITNNLSKLLLSLMQTVFASRAFVFAIGGLHSLNHVGTIRGLWRHAIMKENVPTTAVRAVSCANDLPECLVFISNLLWTGGKNVPRDKLKKCSSLLLGTSSTGGTATGRAHGGSALDVTGSQYDDRSAPPHTSPRKKTTGKINAAAEVSSSRPSCAGTRTNKTTATSSRFVTVREDNSSGVEDAEDFSSAEETSNYINLGNKNVNHPSSSTGAGLVSSNAVKIRDSIAKLVNIPKDLKFSNHDSQVTAFEAEPYPVYLMSSSSKVVELHQNNYLSAGGAAGGSFAQQHAASASSSPTPQTAGMNATTAIPPPPPTATTDTNARMLKRQRMRNKLQRGHHWMPLSEAETGFLMTDADRVRGVYDSSRDKLVFPFVLVNCRFGIIPDAMVEEDEEGL
ncbi:unnamed protein product [Amoebophrya sp. A120]|nr:unnamed protein product [Amoebophrya sp. A120]|eukprot:GSA120T00014257001.1